MRRRDILSPDEQAIAEQEAAEPKTPMGQERADAFFREVANQGLDESPVPEAIFHGKSVDPADIVGTDASQRKFIGRSGMRERLGTDMAIGKIDERLAKDYGINLATEVPTFMLMDNYAGNGRNYEEEWLQNNPDGRIPTYVGTDRAKKGEPYRMQGMVLGVIPREVMDEIQADLDREVIERENALKNGVEELPGDEASLKKKRAETSAAIEKMLAGSSTIGRSLDDALRMYTPEQTAAIIENQRWLNAPKPESMEAKAGEAEHARAQANAIDRAVETAKAQASGKSSFAVSGFKR